MAYTEALALAIPKLGVETTKNAREALPEAARLAPTKVESIQKYLTDDDAEIRWAAARSCGPEGSGACHS